MQDDVTPLFKACHKGHLEVVKELIKHNANVGVLQVNFFPVVSDK